LNLLVFTYTFDIVILSLFTYVEASRNHIALESSRCLDPLD